MPNSIVNLIPRVSAYWTNVNVQSYNGSTNTDRAVALQPPGALNGAGNGYDLVISSVDASIFIGFLPGDFVMPTGSQLRSLQVLIDAEAIPPHNIPVVRWDFKSVLPNQILDHSYTGVLYASNPPGGLSAGALNGPVWDVSGVGITDYQWNNTVWGLSSTSAGAGFSVSLYPMKGSDGASEMHFYVMQIQVGYNQPPTLTLSCSGTTAPASPFAVASLTPTLTWAYSDPEGDPQEQFKVNVFLGSSTSGTLVWSNTVVSSATSYQIPPGILQNYVQYTIQVLVADSGSNGRFSQPSTGSVLTLTPQVDGLLSPALDPQFSAVLPQPTYVWDASSGVVKNLVVSARPNIFTPTDANFESAGTGNVGGWTASTGTLGTATTNYLRGAACMTVTCASGAATFTSPKCSILQGTIYTSLLHVQFPSSTGVISGTLSIIYSNASGTVATISRTVYLTAGTSNFYNECFAQTEAPQSATNVQIQFAVTGRAASEVFYVDCASIVHDELNLLTNSGFEDSAPSWKIDVTGSSSVTFVPGSGTLTSDNGAANGAVVLQEILANTSDNCNCTTGGSLGNYASVAVHGFKMIASCSAKTISGAGRFQIGIDSLGTIPVQGPAAGAGWARIFNFCDATSFSTTSTCSANISSAVVSGGGLGTIQFDDVQLEVVWSPTNLDFETGTGTLPISTLLGNNTIGWTDRTGSGQGVGFGSGIFGGGPFGGTLSGCSFDTSTHNSGTQSLNIQAQPGLNAQATQVFTVGGYTSVAIGWAQKTQNCLYSAVFVQFFDGGGIQLQQNNTYTASAQTTIVGQSGTNGWATVSPITLPIPTGAAYCRVILYNGGSFDAVNPGITWFDSFSINFTGTLGPTPYLDGGWAGGCGGQTWSLGLGRSTDGSISFPSYVRTSAGTATISQPITPTNYQWSFTDYELPVGLLDTTVPQPGVYYSGVFQYVDPALNTVRSFPSPLRYFLQPKYADWWLIDPIIPADNTKLGVIKSVKLSYTEAMTTFDGLGRARRVVIGDTVQGATIDITFLTLVDSTYAALLKQIRKQTPLLLRSPDGEQWYVRPVKRDVERVWTGSYYVNERRNYTIQFVEVDPLP